MPLFTTGVRAEDLALNGEVDSADGGIEIVRAAVLIPVSPIPLHFGLQFAGLL